MNSWLIKLDEVLKQEGVFQESSQRAFAAPQFYADTLLSFAEQFCSWLTQSGFTGRPLTIFVDGVPKSSSECDTIDGAIRHVLSTRGLSFSFVCVSDVLGVAPEHVHASSVFSEALREVVRERSQDVFVTLGSGSLTDLVKHALFLEKMTNPYVSIPTALTVTAYTSAFSVLDYSGVKRTKHSRELSACFWVKPFLECAPLRMSRAGYGDLLAKFVAYGDWYLSHELGLAEHYNELAFRVMAPFSDGLKQVASGFGGSSLSAETLKCTTAALAAAGIAMSLAGETTPLSGFEHVISHGLDFLRLSSGRPLVLHGEQVALGCLPAALCIDWLLDLPAFDVTELRNIDVGMSLAVLHKLLDTAPVFGEQEQELSGSVRQEKMRELKPEMDRARAEFAVEHEKKIQKLAALSEERLSEFSRRWNEIQQKLAQLTIRAAEMEELLIKSGLPSVPEQTFPSTTALEFRWAVRFAPFVRLRMNVCDLLYWLGEDPVTCAAV